MSFYWQVFWTVLLGSGCCIPLVLMISAAQQYFRNGIDDWTDVVAGIFAFWLPSIVLAFVVAWIAVLW